MQELKGAKILVTGGAGFIGSFLVRRLLSEEVAEVVIYDNFARGRYENIADSLEDGRCRIFEQGGDIRDTDVLDQAMKNKDYVFHLAAMWLLHCRDYPRTAFEVNIRGTYNVLEACVNNGIKKLVFSSSASVYGDAAEVPMSEDHPFNNRNFYGATKISGESMCRAFSDRYDLEYLGLRYMNVYGPHQDQQSAYSGVIPIMLNKVDQDEPPVINGDGSQAYDFIYVEDVAEANLRALQADVSDRFYNVGTGKQTTVKDLCDTILRLKDSGLQVTYKPYPPDDARQLVKNRIGSTRRAKDELGFAAQYNLKEGLQKLIRWRDGHRV
ncbi:MAG: NAD-dependent epimerase/dehydratase family protein [Bacteroidales bacterium]|nr:NAD-dependent epimerase/dehydratase family protein [Bacteroidales bacterium]